MIISKTPLRISFFSGGTDMPSYYNHDDGGALSVTIDKYIYVFVHNTPHMGIKIMYDAVEEFHNIEDMQHAITRESLNKYNISEGLTIASISDILAKGSGLGSSSAFTVGLVNCLSYDKFETKAPEYLAREAVDVEMNLCKYPVGKQDQYAAAYGGFNYYTFYKNESVSINPLEISRKTYFELEENLILVYSGIARSANKLLQQHQTAMLNKEKFKLATKGLEKAHEGMKFLLHNDVNSFGDLLNIAWQEKKEINKKVTNNYFDMIYNKALNAGALGGKLIGAGGGGFFLFYVPKEDREKAIKAVTDETECKVYDFKFTDAGSRIVSVS